MALILKKRIQQPVNQIVEEGYMSDKKEIVVPDIGGASAVDVIEILVQPGDKIEQDTPLMTLESDKASMEIPSPAAGIVDSIRMKVGDKASEGDVILVLQVEAGEAPVVEAKTETPAPAPAVVVEAPPPVRVENTESVIETSPSVPSSSDVVFAGPGVRRIAHELGINLADIQGTGRKTRITKEDLQQYVKHKMNQSNAANGFALPTMPAVDFSQFGEIETKALNKIKRLTGANLHRSWVTVPHVTQFDEADITDLEAFRKSETTSECKLTILAFVCKVVSKALLAYPQFNASLDAKGEHLIYKRYVNIGIAVDTPNGLVVPVIKGVDRLSVADIAKEMTRLSLKAREKGLMPNDMSGGCFTISSLGGIGGTAFTPIVNAPEVAILGLSRSSMKPVYQGGTFVPRLMLPLSLSYDHRVIDGAEAARFTQFLATHLADIRRILL